MKNYLLERANEMIKRHKALSKKKPGYELQDLGREISDASHELRLFVKISELADSMTDGWITIKVPASGKAKAISVKVPRIPFERWRNEARFHREEDWHNICPMGMKMMMDDRDHSDWWLGAGMPLKYAYERDNSPSYQEDRTALEIETAEVAGRLIAAAWRERSNRCERYSELGYTFLVRPKVELHDMRVMHVKTPGDVAHFVEEAVRWSKATNKLGLVAVIPRASIEFDQVVYHAAAIITKTGNRAAHIAKVAREQDLPVILSSAADELFFEWQKISLYPGHDKQGFIL